MRTSNPLVALPYWDNSLDEPLPRPEDSVIWTDDFLGNEKGEVRAVVWQIKSRASFQNQSMGMVNITHVSWTRRVR